MAIAHREPHCGDQGLIQEKQGSHPKFVCELRLSAFLEYSIKELFKNRRYFGRGLFKDRNNFVNIGQHIIFGGACVNGTVYCVYCE